MDRVSNIYMSYIFKGYVTIRTNPQQVNHMAGPRGPIGPWLSHKLCNTVDMTPILTMKAAIDCSHHEMHKDIQIKKN
jgi:hypothetical protein